jgi:hypothetical protein
MHPMVLDTLGEGRIHISGLAKLVKHLTVENRERLLARAAHRTVKEIEELIAELSPRPDVPDRIRKLPAKPLAQAAAPLAHAAAPLAHAAAAPDAEAAAAPDAEAAATRLARADGASWPAPAVVSLSPERTDSGAPRSSGIRMSSASFLPDDASVCTSDENEADSVSSLHCSSKVATTIDPLVRSHVRGSHDAAAANLEAPSANCVDVPSRDQASVKIEPLAPGRYKVQFTASASLKEKLERLQGLIRSANRDAGLAAVIEAAVEEKLQRLLARRFGRSARPRTTTAEGGTGPNSRHVPAAVRRAVFIRDHGRCGFVGADGRRCSAIDDVEFHHHHPYGMGGSHALTNIGLRCSTHNGYLAEIDYGRRFKRERQRQEATSGGETGSAGLGRARRP